MTRKQLIMWSAGRDALNFIGIGQLPGLCWLLDLPLIIMHFNYAGPKAVVTLLEAIPLVGFLPIFTVAAMLYPDHDEQTKHETPQLTTVGPVVPRRVLTDTSKRETPPLYTVVDGQLVPIVLPDDDVERHGPQLLQ